MKPDIIKWCDLRWIEGYVGVICSYGRTLHIKNISSVKILRFINGEPAFTKSRHDK